MITKFKIFEELEGWVENKLTTAQSINDIKKMINYGIDYEKNKDILLDFIWDTKYEDFTSDAIKLFLEDGADKIVNYVNEDGENILTIAAYFTKNDEDGFRPSFDIVKMLLEYDINWNFKDSDGNDFIELLDTEEMKEEIINLYPEKYKKYLREKKAKKFKI